MRSWFLQEASETCYQTILKSWSEIDRVASQPKGLPLLSQRFNTCRYKNSCLMLEVRRRLKIKRYTSRFCKVEIHRNNSVLATDP